MKARATGGAIKAAEAANDIDVNSGSALDVQESQRRTGELDTLTTENNALLQAYGYSAAATGYQATAGLESTEAEQAPLGGALSAGGGLLSNASGIGFKFNNILNPSSPSTNAYTSAGP